ncbi:MAG TPA: hypothetical protein VEU51_01595, partial [Candidatus Acidoferrales bacterium]|nr:hypothetical protein [Candidatus Acidoferrales bacterium]
MKHRIAVAATMLASAAFGLACSTPQGPRVEQMYAAPPSGQVAALERGKFAHTTVLLGQITGEEPTGEVFNNLRDALWFAMETSLTRSHIFADVLTNGSADYRIDGTIVSHRELAGSLSATTSVLMVRYKLTDVAGNRVIWQQAITSHYDQPVGGAAATASVLLYASAAPSDVIFMPGNL